MRKPPELLVMLLPAALVTAIVVAFGFVMGGSDSAESAPDAGRAAASQAAAGTVDTSAPDVPAPQAAEVPIKLTGPQVTLSLKPKPKFRTYDAYSFTIASFNVLGHSHTVKGGNRPGYASSATRMGWTVGLLGGQSVDIVGFQEFQATQFHNFKGRVGGAWGVYPGMSAGWNAVENSLAWRTDQFRAVETNVVSIPYFGGRTKGMPYVLLEHIASGQKLWVANFHNPATTRSHGNNFRWRRAATSKEIALANDLAATGYPVFFTGDFNERAEYFCPLTMNTELKAANGGSTGSPCQPPSRMLVDWIFGSDRVEFAGYRVIDGGLVNRTSDHPLVVSGVNVPVFKERIVRKKG